MQISDLCFASRKRIIIPHASEIYRAQNLHPKVLAIVFSNEDYDRTVQSLENQSEENEIIVASKTYPDREHHVRVMRAINDSLDSVNLDDYEYIVITAGDVEFPRNFLKDCMSSGIDVFAPGDVLCFTTQAFKRLGGRVPNNPATDSYLTFLAMENGFKVRSANGMFHPLRRVGTMRSPVAYLEYGKQAYCLGYEPAHLLFLALNATLEFRNPKFLIEPFGYAYALLRKKRKLDVASYVFRKQVGRLIRF